ncbi:DUF2062 domain-containing protein [Cloacibacterium sp. TD35]|uniref:DUF2062 domain-containing protein n=1 Tax=Cloacibacterium sp. TD35 TaxID=2976818 RepID=UPI00237DCBBE|nr:DUF2062 domain-containing protein [Cloacibacterium sp. TD35]WDT68397.1 DUF2062 domain-containing protein [Cloacibacterium sp. TD35]
MKNFIQNSIKSQKVFYRYFRRKGIKRLFKENILESDGDNKTKALSIALGIFIGLTPFWGFHTVLALSLAAIFKLNKFLSFVFSQISIAPLAPFIIGISMFFGSFFVGGKTDFSHQELNLEMVKHNLLQYVVGSFVFATIIAMSFGFIFYYLLNLFQKESTS